MQPTDPATSTPEKNPREKGTDQPGQACVSHMHRPPTIEPRLLVRDRDEFAVVVDLTGLDAKAVDDEQHLVITPVSITPVSITPVSSEQLGFDAFYRRARTSIGRALALALGDADLATEATDEALARAYERWAKVSTLDRPEGWVYRVGLNWATSVLRRRRNHQQLYVAAPVESPVITDPAVHASIAELDIDHRAVVVCRHLLGWSVAETAAALRIREGTVKSRLHRANRILQSRLQHLDPTNRSIADKDI
jgi:RNA polymerase sigma factor (sigma-70 family)